MDIATKEHPSKSSYSVLSGNPNIFIDPLGDDYYYVNEKGVCIIVVRAADPKTNDVFYRIRNDNTIVQFSEQVYRGAEYKDENESTCTPFKRLTDRQRVSAVERVSNPGVIDHLPSSTMDPEAVTPETIVARYPQQIGNIVAVSAGQVCNPRTPSDPVSASMSVAPLIPRPALGEVATLNPGLLPSSLQSTTVAPIGETPNGQFNAYQLQYTFTRPDGLIMPTNDKEYAERKMLKVDPGQWRQLKQDIDKSTGR